MEDAAPGAAELAIRKKSNQLRVDAFTFVHLLILGGRPECRRVFQIAASKNAFNMLLYRL